MRIQSIRNLEFAQNSAIFCYEKYEMNNIDEGYYFVIGEIATMANTMARLDNIGDNENKNNILVLSIHV